MKKQNRMKIMGKENTYLYSLCIVMACMIINMIIWKPYYHVNDDYIIRDILSGRYSGVADAHIYNVIYLFAWILMKLYAMFSTVDIWGGYLWLMMYVCMFLIITRVLRKSGYNVIVLLFTAIFLNIGLLYGMNFFTFTTTGAVCAATGLFLWSTDENKFSWRGYFIPLLLMLASFCTRKDTFFMVLPFYVLACIREIVSSPKRKTVLEVLKIISVLGIACITLWVSHVNTYADNEWQDFLEFRSLRKSVHDFGGYPDYEIEKQLYDEIGISYEEYMAVGTTGAGGGNTALDYSNDIRSILRQVGEWNKRSKQDQTITLRIFQSFETLKNCFNQPQKMTVWMVFILQISFAVDYIINKKYKFLLTSILGSLLFMAEIFGLIYMGRITMAVMNGELVTILLFQIGIYINYFCEIQNCIEKNRNIKMLMVCIGAGIIGLNEWISLINENQSIYANRVVLTNTMLEYCKNNESNIYFEPAIEIGDHSYQLKKIDCDFNNLITLGGWNYSSPEWNDMLSSFGIEGSVEQAILEYDNVYIVSRERFIENILNYFEWKYGDDITMNITDKLNYEFEDIFVYSINYKN